MTQPDLTRLTPADASVALRSLPRRFRAATRPIDDPQVEAWAEIPGPDGLSAIAHVAAATRALTRLEVALHRILTREDPALDAAVTEMGDAPPPDRIATVDHELEALAEAAHGLADRAGSVPASDWGRRGRAPDGSSVEALDVVKGAVRVGLAHLEAAGAAMDRARGEDEDG
ncbi:MAG: hypothetical protein AAGK32_06560 [Actinomycetota bacterium]